MKFLKTSALSVLLSMCLLYAPAQERHLQVKEPDYNKPRIFKDLPEQLAVPVHTIDELLSRPTGSSISIPFTQQFKLQGVIVSKSDSFDANLKSMVVKCSNRLGAVFTIAKITNPDRTVYYTGSIVSLKHGDAYDLTFENGTYYFIKKNLYDLYNE